MASSQLPRPTSQIVSYRCIIFVLFFFFFPFFSFSVRRGLCQRGLQAVHSVLRRVQTGYDTTTIIINYTHFSFDRFLAWNAAREARGLQTRHIPSSGNFVEAPPCSRDFCRMTTLAVSPKRIDQCRVAVHHPPDLGHLGVGARG